MLTKFTSKHCVIILCLFVAVVIIFNSCKKDHGKANEQSVQKLSSWYQNNIKVSQNSSFSKLSPQWDNIEVIEESDQKIYEIGLNNPEKLILMSGETRLDNLEQEEKKHNIRLLIFENKQTGKVLYGCYMSVANTGAQNITEVHYKNVGILTGTITFYNLDGALANGWQYANGKLTKVISASTKLQYEAMMQKNAIGAKGKIMDNGRPPYCLTRIAPRYRIGCVGVSGCERCSYLFDGWDYSDICSYFDNDDGLTQTGGSGGSGGDYYPPIKDCNGVEGGSAYFDSNCGCIGGNTGIVNCGQRDIIDSLKGYPCAQALIKEMKTNVCADIAILIKNTFAKDDLVDIKFVPDKSLVGTSIDGQEARGGSSRLTADFTVGLSPDVLSKSTQEYILVTMYHEALHAFFDRQRQILGQTEFERRYQGVNVSGGRLLGVPDDNHLPMAYQNYVKGLKDVIMKFNTSFNEDRAWALAKGGIIQLLPSEKTINDQERDTTKSGFTGTKCP